MSHGIRSWISMGVVLAMAWGTQAPARELPAGNAANGAQLFKTRCAQCHTFEQGGGNKTGNALFGIMGTVAGTQPGYTYSPAMKDSGITWTDETMFEFLQNPKKFVPKTKMTFAGIKPEQQRADIVAFLNTLSVEQEGH